MKLNRFASFAWGGVGFTVLVIVWGAYVRATGSGAGCGNHWPTCNGAILPRAAGVETLIEFSHRLTSGLAGILAVVLAIWAFRAYPKGNPVRAGAAATLALMIVEGLIGAMLVRLDLVAKNESALRAVVVAFHLMNTFMLLGTATLTAWWASGGKPAKLVGGRGPGALPWLFGLGLLGTLLIGASGAIVALGDTLFPAASFIEGWEQKFDPAAHFLVRLRWVHPLIAMGVGVYLIILAAYFGWPKRPAQLLIALIAIQFLAGAVNVLLLAPVWLQLLHLLLADLMWIVLVVLTADLMGQAAAPAEGRGREMAPSVSAGD